MPARDPEQRTRSARIAALHRWRADEGRRMSRTLAVEHAAELVAELVDADPPLTAAEFTRLALALRGTGTDRVAA